MTHAALDSIALITSASLECRMSSVLSQTLQTLQTVGSRLDPEGNNKAWSSYPCLDASHVNESTTTLMVVSGSNVSTDGPQMKLIT